MKIFQLMRDVKLKRERIKRLKWLKEYEALREKTIEEMKCISGVNASMLGEDD